MPVTTQQPHKEPMANSYTAFAQYGYAGNGIVHAIMNTRLMVFSEARFRFARYVNGTQGDLFGTPALQILERPWRNGTTGELLARMIQDVDLCGNFFAIKRHGEIKRLRPDRVTIIVGLPLDAVDELDAQVIGYFYDPNGDGSSAAMLPVEEVCHWSPIPDPLASYRGMSWLTPVVREIESDTAATEHKARFFENAATPNLLVKFDKTLTREKAETFKELFEQNNIGWRNAFKTLYLGGGSDATVVGSNMEQMDFKRVQGAGETRLAAAGGTPPVIVGLSEGLASATYSNYGQARRRFADGTIRPLWRSAAAALEKIVDLPDAQTVLIADDSHVAFVREDLIDVAEITQKHAVTVRTLIDAGFDPDAAVAAVMNQDLARLSSQHSGLFSVQLQPAGTTTTQPTEPKE